ncbi:thiamine pyrophosphate-dependent dehydrogenase E1 component subunit alpha [Frankia sp. AiPs1]|uniref:thiamine pyrophosphate-dependent dehydrogenase E1 component subunit alpha n=1 Tax=Frankia sp. AiPs1 TaxID=573493 RepID=UPI0020443F47|nr:thiamine pyrophosphate-dependent dehydrogenase E1 component subunit alpha [Frankia sp. AiPs1]MCM3922313.1 thiamine pyrophosphate-dependent dehydrogenase E1 component subunit alpha [Frankia sp. AiPs1]
MNVVRGPGLIAERPARSARPTEPAPAVAAPPAAPTPPQEPADSGVRLLAPDGTRVTDPRFAVLADHDLCREFYSSMVLARRLDEEATALQRQGELVLWIPLRGQEAAQVGSAAAVRPRDFIFPSYREHAVAWHRGVPAAEVIRLLRGVSHDGWDTAEHNMANYTIVLASQTLHAVGYGMGMVLDGTVGSGDPDRDGAVLVYLGDGAMSQGDANEAFVWAASFGAPVVFLCQNNQWAISTPSRRQSTMQLARRADGFGFPGVRVDGNDVLAMHAVTTWALEHARGGSGPVLIEANTYRMAPHTTSDDATRYQPAEELAVWRARDPIERLRRLLAVDVAADWFDEVREHADDAAADLRRACLAMDPPAPVTMFDNVYGDETADQRAQREWFTAYRDSFL